MTTVEILRSWWRVRYPVYVLGIVAGLVMMWLPYKTFHDNDAWEDRLRAEGVPLQGVVDELVRKGRNSTMHLRYELAGVQRRAEVACREACHPAGTPVRIWVDPDSPGDFVTEFGTLSGHRGRVQGVIGATGTVLVVSLIIVVIARLNRQRRDRRQRHWQQKQRDQRRQQIGQSRVRATRVRAEGKPSRRGRKR